MSPLKGHIFSQEREAEGHICDQEKEQEMAWEWGNGSVLIVGQPSLSLYVRVACMLFESMAVFAVSVLQVCCTWLHRESLQCSSECIVGLACHIILCELLEGSWGCISLNSFCPEQGCGTKSWVQTTLSYWFMLISSFKDIVGWNF